MAEKQLFTIKPFTLNKLIYYALWVIGATLLFPLAGKAQDILKGGEVHGSMQADAAYYVRDLKMGITDSALNGNLIKMNGFTEINYTLGNFTAGMRFET